MNLSNLSAALDPCIQKNYIFILKSYFGLLVPLGLLMNFYYDTTCETNLNLFDMDQGQKKYIDMDKTLLTIFIVIARVICVLFDIDD